ncbi:hypothetical protein J2W22_000672 [Sphingomonas kyeonggiensis]|uniref:hypothetical protein n=1 Tax=Sphingomonas kyeonggiensis TaxID=1268553 RepID=UPI00278ACD5F|nr:hypothetical protein [Sphingomonas kyeonggiensis]MDQ0248625.1 hypothetical protein [Sphingomonas kyeonggiensis]
MIGALALLLLAPSETFPDPIGPAAEGKLQCHRPDRARRTCQSLAGYRPDGKGGFLNDAEVLLAPNSPMVMRSVTPVVIRDHAVCGSLTRKSLAEAVFLEDGTPVEPDQAERVRGLLAHDREAIFDREICTRYQPEGDHLRATATLDGESTDWRPMQVIWVRPDEGYRVAH